jgi:hypothetical protein
VIVFPWLLSLSPRLLLKEGLDSVQAVMLLPGLSSASLKAATEEPTTALSKVITITPINNFLIFPFLTEKFGGLWVARW